MTDSPLSIPRDAIISDVALPSHCIKCQGLLVDHAADFMLINSTGEALIGGGIGAFCSQCPVVMFESQPLHALASQQPDFNPFTVIGLLDLSALPPARQNQPLEGPDIPLVLKEFASLQPLTAAKWDPSS